MSLVQDKKRLQLDKDCGKVKEATKKAMENLSANYGVLGDNLKQLGKPNERNYFFEK